MRLLPRRRPKIVPLPGIWPSERLFYETAQSFVSERDDGWDVSTRHPGHRFVAWELAVRYETACRMAELHYTQICDGPTDDEYAVRVAEIERLLDEADRLSELERSIRPALPDDARAIRMLTMSPRPQPIMPKVSRLESLAHDHLPDYSPVHAKLAQLEAASPPFNPQVHNFLTEADRQIPGVGIHTAVWDGKDKYDYPFDYEFEAVLRPLRYVPVYLSMAWGDPIHVRSVVQMATAHLEGCAKKALGKSDAKRPLGALLGTPAAKKLMPSDALAGANEFMRLVGNPSKHDYTNDRSRGSVFIYQDAVFAYFLARRFGAQALELSGHLEGLVAAAIDLDRLDAVLHHGAPATDELQGSIDFGIAEPCNTFSHRMVLSTEPEDEDNTAANDMSYGDAVVIEAQVFSVKPDGTNDWVTAGRIDAEWTPKLADLCS